MDKSKITEKFSSSLKRRNEASNLKLAQEIPQTKDENATGEEKPFTSYRKKV